MPPVLPGRDPEVGRPGLARAVDDAAHDRHLERDLPGLQGGLGLLGHLVDVDLGPAARWAGDEVDVAALTQPERFEQGPARLGLFDRVGGQRVADGVPDPLHEEGGDPGGALDDPGRAAGRPR